MGYAFDPEIARVMQAPAPARPGAPPPPPPTVESIRRTVQARRAKHPPVANDGLDVEESDHRLALDDGAFIRMRWYQKAATRPGSAVVAAHGGGMIVGGGVEAYDGTVRRYVSLTGVPFLSVEYRTAPEVQGDRIVRDVFAALQWLRDRAGDLGVERSRIAMMGESSGGGICAAVAAIARERHIPLARQILLYPMLDDRNVESDATRAPFVTWSHAMNRTAWNALLGEDRKKLTPRVVPARIADLRGLCPAYIEVGDLDIFRDEAIEYAARLARAAVPIELHVWPGAPHGFDQLAPTSRLAQEAWTARCRALALL